MAILKWEDREDGSAFVAGVQDFEVWEQAPGKWDWSPGRCALADSKAAAKDAAERWLAEHVLAPLLPLRSLLPVPDGCGRVRAAVAMRGPDEWDVYGSSDEDDAAIEGGTSAGFDGWRLAGFIVADVKIPRAAEFVGEVSCG